MVVGHLSAAERADVAHHLRVNAARLLADSSDEFIRAIAALHDDGEPIKRIAERFGLTRQRVYALLEQGATPSPVLGIGTLEVTAAMDHVAETTAAVTRLDVEHKPLESMLEALQQASGTVESGSSQ